MKKAVSIIIGMGSFSGLTLLSWKLSNLLLEMMTKEGESPVIRNTITVVFKVLLIGASAVIAALLAQLAYRLWGTFTNRRKKS